MKILILGGTGFLGPAIVDAARPRGHVLTLFNRGRTNPHLFPDLEKLRGDRDPDKGEGLAALRGRTWDSVVDTSGYVPRMVRASADLLAPSVRQYVFVSSVSVYSDFSKPGINENSSIGKLADPASEDFRDPELYGPLKAACEEAAEKAMPGRVMNIRPGLIVGPGDPTDRFTYWPGRVERGGEILAPGDPAWPVQFLDVRDLAEWIVRVIEDGHVGVCNAVGPSCMLTMQELLHGCKCVSGHDAEFAWAEEAWLLEQGVRPWLEMPLWVPKEGMQGFSRVAASRARSLGLMLRAPAQTIEATLQWHRSSRPSTYEFGAKAGMTSARERELLAKLRESKANRGP